MVKRNRRSAHKKHIAIIAGPETVADAIDAAAQIQSAGFSITLHPKTDDTAASSPLTNADAVLVLVNRTGLRSKRMRQAATAAHQAKRRLYWLAVEPLNGVNVPLNWNIIDGSGDLSKAITRFLNAFSPAQKPSPVIKHSRVFLTAAVTVFILLLALMLMRAFSSQQAEAPDPEASAIALMLDADAADVPVMQATGEVTPDAEATADPDTNLRNRIAAVRHSDLSDETPVETTDEPSALTADFMVDTYFGDAPLVVKFRNMSAGDIVSYAWDFNGDGITDSSAKNPPPYTYTQPGGFDMALTVTGASGETDTRYEYIEVYAPSAEASLSETVVQNEALAAGFTASPSSGTAPLTVSFSNRSSGEISAYAWDFDSDGITDSTAQSPAPYTYTTPGEYRISLAVTGANGVDTATEFVTVERASTTGAPAARFIVTPRSGNPPLKVSVTNRVTGDITSYAWDFNGDGITDSTEKYPPSYTYTAAGEYLLTLTVTGRSGTASTSELIRVGSTTSATVEPTAIFVASPLFGTAPLTVNFNNRSAGIITGYAWDFNGDGRTDSTAPTPPSYTYTQPGDYTVTLKVTGAGGLSDTISDVITVEAPEAQPPTAAFQARPLTGKAPLTVTFTGQSIGTISAYAWDFNGDGRTDSTAKNPPPYIYTQAGEYTVSLKVTGAGGLTDSTTDTVTVEASDNSNPSESPLAIFVATPLSGTAPLTVTMMNLSDGVITGYAWDFNGDNITDSTAQNPPPYTYTQPGNFTITLRVTGAGGLSDTTFEYITVDAPQTIVPPFAAFVATSTSGTAPLNVTFTNQSSGDIASYAWDFNGDNMTDITVPIPPAYVYTQPGTYTVTLRLSGSDGTTATASTVITVTAPVIPPAAAFTLTPASGTAPLTVTFTNTSTGNIASYAWDFNGDNLIDSTEQFPPAYTFTVPGTYTVKLTVIAPDGTSAFSTAQVTVTLPPEPAAAFTATPLAGNAPLTVSLTNTSTGDGLTFGWDFEDDGVIDSLEAHPVPYTFTTPGTYNLTLSARDRHGRIHITSVMITVTGVPPTQEVTPAEPDLLPTEAVTPPSEVTAEPQPETPLAEITSEAVPEPDTSNP